MVKLVSIVGARPHFIKAAVVSRALWATGQVGEVLVHTGQHNDNDTSRIFFEETEIPEPDCSVRIESASCGAQTRQMLGTCTPAIAIGCSCTKGTRVGPDRGRGFT